VTGNYPFRTATSLVFTRDARRFLALALLASDDERLVPPEGFNDAGLELVTGGYGANGVSPCSDLDGRANG
jgi:hypothetical protein